MKIFKNFTALFLASSMVLSSFATTALAAGEYDVGLTYDSSLGTVSIEASSAANVNLAAAPTHWEANGETGVAAGQKYITDDNLEMTGTFATTLKESSHTINGKDYTHYIQVRIGGSDPKTEADITEQAKNTPLIITMKNSGTLTYTYRRQANNSLFEKNDGKDCKISKINADGTLSLAEGGTLTIHELESEGAYAYCDRTLEVETGERYVMWARGTTINFYALDFTEKQTNKITAGDTVTITSTPNENALLGNVSLDDSSIELTKNSDYTVCSFVMPEKNVNVKVDFIKKSVEEEANDITFDMIKGDNTAEDSITENLDTNSVQGWTFSIGYADIAWESSAPEVISNSGVVNTDANSHDVTFTAVCTFQDYPNLRIEKKFNLTVPADADDNAAVAAAKEALTLGDLSAVKNNITLPTTGRRSTTITWASSNTEVISNDGVVTRKKEVNTEVTLTATITRGTASDTKEFKVTVLGYTPVEVARIAISNSEGRIVSAPVDGGYVSHIVYTDSISTADRTNNEVLIVAVYDKSKNGELKSYGVFELKDITETPGEEKIFKLEANNVPVDSNSEIKVFAFESMDSIKPLMNKAYTYEQKVSEDAVVYVAGDSTASLYEHTGTNNRFPQTGWAQVINNFFTLQEGKIQDLALSGRSSKSFRGEKNYSTIMDSLKPGDYFIIQFGHNDAKSGEAERYTDPDGDRFTEGSFKHSLYQYYVKPALEKGANPIITTPIIRRKGIETGHEKYVAAAKSLAEELALPYVDLYARIKDYAVTVSDTKLENDPKLEKAKDLFLYTNVQDERFLASAALPASFKDSIGKSTMGEVSDYENSQNFNTTMGDDTHLNYYGAQMVSQWFCDELEAIGHPLTSKRSTHTISLDDIPAYTAAATN